MNDAETRSAQRRKMKENRLPVGTRVTLLVGGWAGKPARIIDNQPYANSDLYAIRMENINVIGSRWMLVEPIEITPIDGSS